MFIMGLLSWWYGAGWRGRAVRLREKLASSVDYFSIDLLLRTFFSPFRQISAGKVNGSLSMQLHAFVDRLISRVIGAMIRLVMIIVGLFAIFFNVVIGVVLLIVWAVMPLLPFIGVMLAVTGWMPWK
jgi:vacuolar-type H+-ATPase subunit I/STV1